MLSILRRWREYRKNWKAIRIAEQAYDEYLARSGCKATITVKFLTDGFTETDRRLMLAYIKTLYVQCDGDEAKMMEQEKRIKLAEVNHSKEN